MRITNIASLLLALSIGCSTPKGIQDTAEDTYTEGSQEGDCSDEVDNDEDGLTDCEDDGCFGLEDCAEGGGSDGSTGGGSAGNTGDGSGSTGDGTTGGTTSGDTTSGETSGTDGGDLDSGLLDTGLDGATDGAGGTGTGTGTGTTDGGSTGDDDPTDCEDDEVLTCSGSSCTMAAFVGDGECDSFLDCAETGYDGGDCDADTTGGGDDDTDSIECPDGEVPSCSGLTCWSDDKIGDGSCDEYLDCDIHSYDGGDC